MNIERWKSNLRLPGYALAAIVALGLLTGASISLDGQTGSGYFLRVCGSTTQCHTVPLVTSGALVVDTAAQVLTNKTLTTPAITTTATVTRDNVLATTVDGIVVQNTTAATLANVVQRSAMVSVNGSAWDTDDSVSRTLSWRMQNRGISGTAPSAQLSFSYTTDGGAETNVFRISSTGTMIGSGGIFSDAHQMGSTTRGFWTLTSDGVFSPTNAAGTSAGAVLHRYLNISQAASTTLTETQSGEIFITGDADGATLTLPNDPTTNGFTYGLAVRNTVTSNDFRVIPSAGETMYDGTSTCSALSATAIGSTIWVTSLLGGSGGIWAVTAKAGSWTCTP